MVQTLINKQEVTIRSFSTTTKSVQYEDQQSMASGRRDFLFFLTQFRIPFLGSILVPTGQIIMTMCQLKKRDVR